MRVKELRQRSLIQKGDMIEDSAWEDLHDNKARSGIHEILVPHK